MARGRTWHPDLQERQPVAGDNMADAAHEELLLKEPARGRTWHSDLQRSAIGNQVPATSRPAWRSMSSCS
ncbi:hypothetical protein ACFSR7_06125 [Cohnella sp. GCM10020058]|uniref:hypothetical protein n=1 Tax=Cohnella sp. GCM10020058 TaxID=3317330 RepID=UPI00363CF2E8